MNTEDIKHMLRAEIQSISHLEERVVFKELMERVFLSFYETNERMYQELETRIMNELIYDVNHYLIKTGVVERQFLDASHHFMFPMIETDMEEATFTVNDIAEAIAQNGAFHLMKVMLQCDYLELQQIWQQVHTFKAVLELDEACEITVEIRQNQEYLRQLEALYQLFVRNGVPWQTVNAPYLYKMADVVITALPQNLNHSARIQAVRIDFGAYSTYIRYDLIPIWNVQKIRLDTVGFPIPCEDHQSYEHNLSVIESGEEHAYLVNEKSKLYSVRRSPGKLSVISTVAEAQRWEIYAIKSGNDRSFDHYTYPVMQNLRNNDFMEKYQQKWNRQIKTRAELVRFIQGFGLEHYIRYQGCELKEQFEPEKETYNMNSFIADEIRETRYAKKLVLSFQTMECEAWLKRDIASFIVTEVQRIYPEYECGGVFV